jgi:RNA polymerase sigma-70 factor (ECF subfamily)
VDIYRQYGSALQRKAERILGNRADAQDLVQGLFVDLLSRGQTDVDLPYLYRAITNRCLNWIRDRKNQERLLGEQEPSLRGPVRVRCDDEVIGVDLLLKLSQRLDERESEVLVNRYFDDLTQDEIATLCDTSRKTVGKRLDRIRDEVRALAAERSAG